MAKLSPERVLIDTLEYYGANLNRRCEKGGRCYYNPASVGKEKVSDGCAIGRHMTQEQKEEADYDYNNTSVDNLSGRLIPKKLAHLDMEFLICLQGLHDSLDYWEKSKGNDILSDAGKTYVWVMMDEHNLNPKKLAKYLE